MRLRSLLYAGLLSAGLVAAPAAFAQHHGGSHGDSHGHASGHYHGGYHGGGYRGGYHGGYHRPPVVVVPAYRHAYPLRRTPYGWYDRFGHFHRYHR